MPIMIGGGEFIINGAERVVVSQLHRSPGVDFVVEIEGGERRSCTAAGSFPSAAAGSRSTSPRRTRLSVRIDQSGKFSAMTLLRAMDPKYSHERADHPRASTRPRPRRSSTAAVPAKLEGKIAVDDVIYPASSERAGEINLESGQKITKNVAKIICTSGLTSVEVMPDAARPADLQLPGRKTRPASHEEALLKIYQRLRPGNPPQLEKARELFREKFFDSESLSPGQSRPLPHQSQVRPGNPRDRR